MLLVLLLPAALAGGPLPGGWSTSPPQPQTFTATYRYDTYSSCSQSWSIYTVDAAMTLTLAEDGAVSGCRERRAEDRGPDGRFISADFQSLSGTYARKGDWISMELTAGGDRCGEPKTSYHELKPWKLRCTQARPPAETVLGQATAGGAAPLVCLLVESVYTESLGMELRALAPAGEWLVLGAGPGLAIVQDFNDSYLTGVFAGAPEAEEPVRITPLSGPPALGSRVADLVFEPR